MFCDGWLPAFLRNVPPIPLFNPEDGAAGFCVTLLTRCQSTWHHIPDNSNVYSQFIAQVMHTCRESILV